MPSIFSEDASGAEKWVINDHTFFLKHPVVYMLPCLLEYLLICLLLPYLSDSTILPDYLTTHSSLSFVPYLIIGVHTPLSLLIPT